MLGSNPHTLVRHPDRDRLTLPHGGRPDLSAAGGVFDGVLTEVPKHRGVEVGIPLAGWQTGRNIDDKGVSRGARSRLGDDGACQRTDQQRLSGRLQATGQNGRKAEHVADHAIEPLTLGDDVDEELAPRLLVQILPLVRQQVRAAMNRGQRSPELVRDEGEEVILRLLGLAEPRDVLERAA